MMTEFMSISIASSRRSRSMWFGLDWVVSSLLLWFSNDPFCFRLLILFLEVWVLESAEIGRRDFDFSMFVSRRFSFFSLYALITQALKVRTRGESSEELCLHRDRC